MEYQIFDGGLGNNPPKNSSKALQLERYKKKPQKLYTDMRDEKKLCKGKIAQPPLNEGGRGV